MSYITGEPRYNAPRYTADLVITRVQDGSQPHNFNYNFPQCNQIHSYLSSNFRDLRGLEKGDSVLRAKGKDRYYVPDPRKAADYYCNCGPAKQYALTQPSTSSPFQYTM